MLKAIEDTNFTSEISLQKTAWKMRDEGGGSGRAVEKGLYLDIINKGLEFDHCIVVNADELNVKEFAVYVNTWFKNAHCVFVYPYRQKRIACRIATSPKAIVLTTRRKPPSGQLGGLTFYSLLSTLTPRRHPDILT